MKMKNYELIIDNFAGGGGASTGMELGLNRHVDVAINHDPIAIEMHKRNHPETKHYNENIWNVDPVEVCNGRPIGHAWFSPDCKHFSKARGGTPVDKSIRGLAWVVLKWAASVPMRVFYLENVTEFLTWGPVEEVQPGKFKPVKELKGTIFDAFIAILTTGLNKNHFAWDEIKDVLGHDFEHYDRLESGLGYKVEHRLIEACDYGAPTSRKRLYLIGRNDGEPIIWPKPTHGPNSKSKLPYRSAASIIDWSIPSKSIFNRKRPLAENTMKRIAKGIKKFVIDNPKPFIVRIGQTGFGKDNLSWHIDKPLSTVTSKAEHLLVSPFISRVFGASVGHEASKPLATVTAGGGGKSQLVEASFIAKHYTGATGSEIKKPLSTITSIDHNALVTSHMIKFRGDNPGNKTDEPVATISAGGNHIGEVRAFMLKYYGTNIGHDLNDPVQTVTTKDRFGLVTVHGQLYQLIDIQMRMLQPHELFAAQGFPKDYKIKHDTKGNKLSKSNQVARCGNAVCPPVAQALVAANS